MIDSVGIVKSNARVAKKVCAASGQIRYASLFWLFTLGSLAGYYLEGVFSVLCTGAWSKHSSTVIGPFCLIYGVGAVIIYIVSAMLVNKGSLHKFFVFMLAGTAVEYFGSLFQEICFGSTSWDYSTQFLNIGGRVSVGMSLLWGLLGLAFAKFAFPVFNRVFAALSGRSWRLLTVFLSVFMVANLILSTVAVARWRARLENPQTQATSYFIQTIDNTYNNDKMSEIFVNMNFYS